MKAAEKIKHKERKRSTTRNL